MRHRLIGCSAPAGSRRGASNPALVWEFAPRATPRCCTRGRDGERLWHPWRPEQVRFCQRGALCAAHCMAGPRPCAPPVLGPRPCRPRALSRPSAQVLPDLHGLFRVHEQGGRPQEVQRLQGGLLGMPTPPQGGAAGGPRTVEAAALPLVPSIDVDFMSFPTPAVHQAQHAVQDDGQAGKRRGGPCRSRRRALAPGPLRGLVPGPCCPEARGPAPGKQCNTVESGRPLSTCQSRRRLRGTATRRKKARCPGCRPPPARRRCPPIARLHGRAGGCAM